MRVLEGVGLLLATTRVLARARTRSSIAPTRWRTSSETSFRSSAAATAPTSSANTLLSRSILAIRSSSSAHALSVARNSSSAFSDCLTAPSEARRLAKPGPGARLPPGSKPVRVGLHRDPELGLGANGFGAALVRLLPQRSELGLGG